MKAALSQRLVYLRKESGYTQKQAATKLDISQALLSHYEKGIRECGLEFLCNSAELYSVSTDYLLGRTNEKNSCSNDISEESAPSANDKSLKGSIHINLGKKMIQNSISLIYDLLGGTNNKVLASELTNFLSFPLYKIVRYIYEAKNNPPGFFTLPLACFPAAVDSQALLCEMRLKNMLLNEAWPSSNHPTVDPDQIPKIDHQMLSSTYPSEFSSLLNILHSVDSKCLPGKMKISK